MFLSRYPSWPRCTHTRRFQLGEWIFNSGRAGSAWREPSSVVLVVAERIVKDRERIQSTVLRSENCLVESIFASSQRKLRGYIDFFKFDVTVKK